MTSLAATFDRVHDGRTAFRAAFAATCDPGAVVACPRAGLVDDVALDRAAAVLLALLDPGVGLAATGDAATQRLAERLRALTLAGPAPEADADYVLAGPGAPAGTAGRVRRGTDLSPEQGATIIYAGAWSPVSVALEGPGLPERRLASLRLPEGETAVLRRACAAAPRGVDALVAHPDGIAAVPRSVRIEEL
jgi:alpha-D-ribose 1-methylphosphonate 5-triphosphate synthase subunit PhnH